MRPNAICSLETSPNSRREYQMELRSTHDSEDLEDLPCSLQGSVRPQS